MYILLTFLLHYNAMSDHVVSVSLLLLGYHYTTEFLILKINHSCLANILVFLLFLFMNPSLGILGAEMTFWIGMTSCCLAWSMQRDWLVSLFGSIHEIN